MTVAIIHYHLSPGGVTRVLEAASLALTSAGIQHVILTGVLPSNGWGVPGPRPGSTAKAMAPRICCIPGLGYLDSPGKLTAADLTESIRAAASDALGSPPDLWHFHNHSLGKNPLIPEVVALLALNNERLILQIHDLAEQGRPANYPSAASCRRLYPVSSRIHYAFINSRDREIFTAAGLAPENSSVLANSIRLPSIPSPPAAHALNTNHSAILFAPIRGIRRKNLGELVLLASLAPVGTLLAVSRAPQSTAARPIHDAWQKFAADTQLSIEFDVSDRLAPSPGAATHFESWLAHASHIVSTSVSEGFGLPFLEAAAHGIPLIGRNLPHLTTEHARHGIRPGHLYDRLLIPTDWVDLTHLGEHLRADLERNYQAYRRPLSRKIIEATLAGLHCGDPLDFGNLPELFQQTIIKRLGHPGDRGVPQIEIGGRRQPAAEWLATAIANRRPTAKRSQLKPYSLENYQVKLTAIYQSLIDQAPARVGYLPAEKILTACLAPSSFHFLLSALKISTPPAPPRAVIFDIYGTLLIARAGGVKPDLAADPLLGTILKNFGHLPPESPSTALHAAVLRHHAAAGIEFPEVDLRQLWREVLDLPADTDTTALVNALEAAWHPATLMPGASAIIRWLDRSGVFLGLLSNAQSHTLSSLGDLSGLFTPELVILSYQHGMAKPSTGLLDILTTQLAAFGILPAETLIVGNDPLHDIAPAAAAGFKTALFTGHPDSLRPGDCMPDITFHEWSRATLFPNIQ